MCVVTIEQLMGKEYPKRPNNIDESNEAEAAVEEARDVVRAMYRKNEQYLTEVLEGVRNDSIVPFIGAGFSAGSYPLWRNLLLGLASGVSPKLKKKANALLDCSDFEGAASLLDEELVSSALREEIAGAFGAETLDEAFEKLTPERQGIPAAFRGFVLTTNYDRLIERAYEAAGARLERVCPHTAYQYVQAVGGVQGNGPLLLKLHGDAWDPTNAVITREDYDRVYGTGGEVAPLVEAMRRAFTGRRVLFLGCSLVGDRPLDVLHGCCEGATHYALVELPTETENPDNPFAPVLVDSEGDEILAYRNARQSLRRLGIRPIWYPHGQHEALDALLGWLEGELGPLPGGAAARLASIPESTYGIVGREDEVSEVVASLSGKPSITLVTGPGGIGKTEVCREALRRFRDSGRDIVYAVTVGASTAWAQCDAVADALGAPRVEQREGVRAADYARYLTDKLTDLERPVVYFDNWEDAWLASDEEGRRELVGLLQNLCGGGSSILVSSREIAADYETGAMTIEILGLERKPSVDLFRKVFRMKGGLLDPSGSELEELIGKLEGHPLAIVLAATLATRSPSWSDVLNRWTEASHHAGDPRHNSLKTALLLSWDAVADALFAHDLWGVMAFTPGDLPRSELDILARFSETDVDYWLDSYSRLRDASLMSALEDGSLSMLRPVREAFFLLAEDHLIDNCLGLLTARLVELLFADIGETGIPGIGSGPAHDLILTFLPRALFLLNRSLDLYRLDAGAGVLACALANYYQFDWTASRPVLDALLRIAREEGDDGLAALIMYYSAECAMYQGRSEEAGEFLREVEFLYQRVGGNRERAYVLHVRAKLAMRLGRLGEAGPLLEEAERLHRKVGDDLGMANVLHARAELTMRLGRLGEAGPLLEEAERLHRKAGDDLGMAFDLTARAELAINLGDLNEAGPLLEEAERLHRRVGSALGMANVLHARAELAMRLGRLGEAGPLLEEAERLHRRAGCASEIAVDLSTRAQLLAFQGDFVRALLELTEAERLFEEMGAAYDLECAHQLRKQIEQATTAK